MVPPHTLPQKYHTKEVLFQLPEIQISTSRLQETPIIERGNVMTTRFHGVLYSYWGGGGGTMYNELHRDHGEIDHIIFCKL